MSFSPSITLIAVGNSINNIYLFRCIVNDLCRSTVTPYDTSTQPSKPTTDQY